MVRLLLVAMCSVYTFSALFSVAQDAPAPAPSSPETAFAEAVLTKLSPPVYPPLARQARIMGDVKICVHVRKDGSVESLELFSGHPMLAPTAIESARKSQFECRGCGKEVSSYLMTYTFGFLDDGKSREVVSEHPARAGKCLYLWKCGIGRTSTWQCPEGRPTEIAESHGHVTILVSTVCVETERSY